MTLSIDITKPLPGIIAGLIDETLVRAFAQPDASKPTCRHGCFHCCKEPVYSARSEVAWILETLTPVEKLQLAEKLRPILAKLLESGLANEHMPNAFQYRSHNLWCPLLAQDGTCSVYEHRPMACRLHVARKAEQYCANDELRPKQEFVSIPALTENIFKVTINYISQQPEGYTDVHDNFLILLAEALIGGEYPKGSRMELRRTKDSIEKVSYGE